MSNSKRTPCLPMLSFVSFAMMTLLQQGQGSPAPQSQFIPLSGPAASDPAPSGTGEGNNGAGNIIPADPPVQFTLNNPQQPNPTLPTSGTGVNLPLPSLVPRLDTLLGKMAESSALFTWDAYRGLAAPPGDNVFFSPYSIMNALGMLAMGSGQGAARDQLETALRVDSALPEGALDMGIQQENVRLRSDDARPTPGVTFLVANKFYVDRRRAANINPEYLQNISDFYGASMQAVNFSTDLAGTVRLINTWVSDNTRGKITNLIPNNLDPNSQLILANAIYFNGTWNSPFNPSQTFPGKFRPAASGAGVEAPTVPVSFMTQSSTLNYAADDEMGVETVVLPYSGDSNIAMHIVLPNVGKDLESLEANGVLNAQALRRLASKARPRTVELSMPKFSLRQQLELTDLMDKMKVTDIFHPLKNDFGNIFLNPRPGFFVNQILHQAVVEVDEKGTVAAAATAVVGTRSSFPRTPVLVNRPFLFYIADETNGFILFWGRVGNPAK